MALFEIKMDGMGFTNDPALTEFNMTEADAAALTTRLKSEGKLPAGVVEILGATVSPDEGQGKTDIKVFASVELVVEAKSLEVAESDALELPEEFLIDVVTEMIKRDADSTYDLRGTFEVLDSGPHEPSTAGPIAQPPAM